MTFKSILFKKEEEFDPYQQEPKFFADLNLNLIVDEITKTKEVYDLKPFFYHSLKNRENIIYRQKILTDIEQEGVFGALKEFEAAMNAVRDGLKKVEKLSCKYQKERWFLDSADLYCCGVLKLNSSLSSLTINSEGLLSFSSYLESYIASDKFKEMLEHTKILKQGLDEVKYTLFIKENKIRVEKYKNEKDYGKTILEVFERFRQFDVEDFKAEFHNTEYANHIEIEILKCVAELNRTLFDDLEGYCLTYENFIDEYIKKFNKEVQFYISYLEYIKPLEDLQLRFCYPQTVQSKEDIHNIEGFDMALGHKLAKEDRVVVSNDFYLKGKERIIIVTGPNQGGKTTFARAFGQIHFLASLGLKVPGSKAKLLLFDNIFTHFEKEESIQTLIGKLENDLVRIKDILAKATGKSIIIMNEIFSSTSFHDALFLAQQVLKEVIKADSLCVFVTFLDALTELSDKIVSMTSTVKDDDVSLRTYKIIRRQADGIAYAVSIAKKHGLTYECLIDRLMRG